MFSILVHGPSLDHKGHQYNRTKTGISLSYTIGYHFHLISTLFFPLSIIPVFYTLISRENKLVFFFKYYITLTHQSLTILGKENEMDSQRPFIFFNSA